ncbi:Alanine racemase, biosynthetic [Serratia fonticola]|uniref:Alanine racemase, biosynthetic n=1 Tax=Serratia fonticola TaxID=47917 RepID=A0A4U9THR5_SERFO|nr:Alanine racemase, biosynthetic [Serratia fonticola]
MATVIHAVRLPARPVWLNGREVPIVGRVSMDMISVDLGPNASDKVGDEVVLWGNELPVERVAAFSGISAYELITKLNPARHDGIYRRVISLTPTLSRRERELIASALLVVIR